MGIGRVHVVVVWLALAAACVSAPTPGVDHGSFEDVRRIVNALDDVAGDYSNAVADGAVADPVRMRVLERLLHDAQRYAEHLTGRDREALAALVSAIAGRAPAPVVVATARRMRAELLARRRIVLAPAAPPPLARVRALWSTMCTACHGDTGIGDGPQGLFLEPGPKDFQELEFIVDLAPSRAYSRITDGMAGTAMPSFGIPTSAERWGLAALVLSFRHDDAAVARGRAFAQATGVAPPWTSLADRSDAELTAVLIGRGVPAPVADDVLAYLRVEVAFAPVAGRLADARVHLAAALDAYQARRWGPARARIVDARRGLRDRLVAVAAVDRALAARIDEQLARLLALVDRGALEEALAHEVVRTQALFDRAELATARLTAGRGAGLMLERGGLAILALGCVLAARSARRRAVAPALGGVVVGAAVGWGAAGGGLAAATGLALVVLLVGQARRAAAARVFAVAALLGLALGSAGRGVAAVGPVGAPLALGGALAVVAVAAIAFAAARLPRSSTDAAIVAITAVTAGQVAMLAWSHAAHPAALHAWPRIDALGVAPIALAPIALAGGALAAALATWLAARRRAEARRPVTA
ncbi:MAG: c-type cytochrome [Kofleriaceae bacterium]|nr:c-type cytochrome [Kofleriaceae bacterium]